MKIVIPIQIIELEETNVHAVISSEFEDGSSGKWLIDTGASKTVFDKNKIQYFNNINEEEEILSAGISELPLKISLAILKPIHFGKLKIEDLKVALLDMNHINKLYLKSVNFEIFGFLGGDFLMKYKAEISYRKKLLILNI